MSPQVTYRLTALHYKNNRVLRFDKSPVTFIPIHARAARVFRGNGWPSEQVSIPSGILSRIDYTINATTARFCLSEAFTHSVVGWCGLSIKDGEGVILGSPLLFKSESLSFVMTGKKSAKLVGKAIQFVC